MTLSQPLDTLSTGQRIRVWVGTFIVDYVETFVGLLPTQLVAALLVAANAASLDQAKVAAYQIAIQVIGPAVAALISAGRRSLVNAWPALKAFFASGFGAIK